jgi:YVTN family beta-propeller protein/VCBS repeat-containing protein
MAHRQPYAWLGIGAVTVGVGAALAGGTGAAHADTGDARSPGISSHAGDSSRSPRKAAAASPIRTKASAGANRVPAPGIIRHSSALPPPKRTTKATTQTAAAAPAATIAARTATAATPTLKTTATATVASNPIASLLAAVSSLFGLNTPTAPVNPLTGLLWGLFRGLNNSLGFTPQAGVPTIGPPDPNTGTVTGTWQFTEPAGLDMTYLFTGAANGEVHAYTNGTYSYTPSTAARQTATATTTDSFAITADDGVASTSQTITVPVLPLSGAAGPGIITGVGGTHLTMSPDGSRIYALSDQNNVSVIATNSNTVIKTIGVRSGSDSQSQLIAANPNGSTVYVLDGTDTFSNPYNGVVSVIDTATNTVTAHVGNVDLHPYAVVFNTDGTRAYLVNASDLGRSVQVVNAQTNTVINTIDLGIGVAGDLHGSANTLTIAGSTVYFVDQAPGANDIVTAVDTTTNAITNITIPPDQYRDSAVSGVIASSDGSTVYVSHAFQDTNYNYQCAVSVIDTATNSVTGWTVIPAAQGGSIGGMALSPDGSYLYLTVNNNDASSVAVYKTADDAIVDNFTALNGWSAGDLAISPDGGLAYIDTRILVGDDRGVQVIET